MPTYDYQCLTCGHRFEYFQSISSEALHHCPHSECIQEDEEKKGTGEVVRMVSAGAGILFKGAGFYQTDYVRKGEGSASSGGSSTGGKGGGSSSGTAAKSASAGEGSGASSDSAGSGSTATGGASSGSSASGD